MALNLTNFLHSLCRYLATRTGLEYLATPRAIWRGQADESVAAAISDPYSVIRIYGGPGLAWHPLPRISVQVKTVGSSAEAALNRGQLLFEAFCLAREDGGPGTPLRMTSIAGYLSASPGTTADGTWMIVSADPLQRPGSVGVDEKMRSVVSFNVDVGFFKAT